MPVERRDPAVCNDSNKKEGKGEMTKAPICLQDLRRSLYVKAKAEPTWRFWGCTFMSARWKRGIVGCLHYGPFFLFVPSILLLGAIVEPWLPRLGRVLLAVGAAALTFYSLFLGLPAVLLIRGLGTHHSLEDSTFLVLSLLSVLLVILCDVMLVKNERKLRQCGYRTSEIAPKTT
jgi:hypothetical protein